MDQVNNDIALRTIRKVNEDQFTDTGDLLAAEEPLEISLAYNNDGSLAQKIISVTMRTPGNDEELALGFLFTEGIVQDPRQVRSAAEPAFTENKIFVTLNEEARPVLQKTERNFYTTSSCGICGKASIDAIKTASVFPVTNDDIEIDAALLYALPEKLRAKQVSFNSTGGLHASALFDLAGNFTMLREDVGRHNALDKIIGAAFTENRLPLSDTILLLSGRASFELVQKAMMAGIKIIAAIGAPSTLAVQAAEDAGITLVGFLRKGSFNIYSHNRRIKINK